MGRLEKIVVLTVLFLVAVVLGVALTPAGEKNSDRGGVGPVEGAMAFDPSAQDPKGSALDERLLSMGTEGGSTLAGAPKPAPAPVVQPTPPAVQGQPGGGAAPLADVQGAAGSKGAPPAPAPIPAPGPVASPSGQPVSAPPAPPPAAYVLTTEGLTPTGISDTMMYTWQAGDSFAAVAQRYYGSKEKLSRLSKANEGRAESGLVAGDRIWVPVAESAKAEALATGEKIYVVQKGDMLGTISQQHYGTAKKWQKILDANRDTLSSPEKLRPGMKLRIPE